MTTPNVDHPEQEKDPMPAISRRAFRQATAPSRDETEDLVESEQEEQLSPAASTNVQTPSEPVKIRRTYKFMPAFWTIVCIFSLVVNVVLISVMVSLGGQIGSLKAILKDQLVSGLATNFQLMDQAHIKTTITINTKVPAKFEVPLNTDTMVTLTKDTTIKTARVTVTTGGLQITNAPATIILPAGTQLPIHLDLSVPIDEQIPVSLTVPVDIALNQTDLHKPFVGLQDTIRPYRTLLDGMPNSWREIVCGQKPGDMCRSLIP